MKPQANDNLTWTEDLVFLRFKEADRVAHQLPPASTKGYFNCWPQIIRQQRELRFADTYHHPLSQPSPKSIERMQEVMQWVQWLPVNDRLLLWEFARGTPREEIATRFGISRSTAWRRWRIALDLIARNLNDKGDCCVLK